VDTKTFLSRVSAALDDVVVCLWKPDPAGLLPNGIFWNRGSFSSFDDAAAAIQKWDKDPDWTVYYSVGRMANHVEVDAATGKTKYRRTKAHASWFKAICFDLDIGGKYATQGEGHKAVLEATRAMGMPAPMVVSSGRGIHYYWPLVEPITAATWEQVSMALRAALEEYQVQIDVSKIHDTSMILRPAETHHKKQVPWKDVKVLSDCPDYDIADITVTLSKWIGAIPAKAQGAKRTNSIMSAILDNCNLNVEAIGKKCQQVGALMASGGEFDVLGNIAPYGMWTASLMLAKFTPDPDAAIMMLCSAHPDFDMAASQSKMGTFSGKPPSCDQFEKACPGGCNGCPSKGVVFGPGSLNEEVLAAPTTPTALAIAAAAGAPAARQMPPDYYISNGQVFTDVTVEIKNKDEVTGKTIVTKNKVKTLVCPYEIHVLAMYHDVWGPRAAAHTAATALISVKYPMDGEHEHEMPMVAVTNGGKDFSTYLGNKQIIIASETVQNRTRSYLMNYLASVQARAASGVDFTHFGWQKDGSFLCGETLVGSPSQNTLRRLKGTAKNYSDQIKHHGDRNAWADLTSLIDQPGGEPLGVSLLMACAGALGNVSGAATPLISFVAPDSGTGKTLSLGFGNSAFMSPNAEFMFGPNDTPNARYNGFGILGDLSASMDEITTMEPMDLVSLAYAASHGTEKRTLTQDRSARVPESWRAPVRVTANRSLFEVYEIAQSKDEPLRMRTMEFLLDTRTFVAAHGKTLYLGMHDNYGFALPEIADAIITMGGRRAVWDKGAALFESKFDKRMQWLPEERFRRNATAVAFIVGRIGKQLGLFRFDVDRVINYILDNCLRMRANAHVVVKDAFDIIGQFMQEHNDQLITTRKVGGAAEQVQFPVPQVACMRMELILDSAGVLQPGSRLAINNAVFKSWLRRTRDSLERVTAELQAMGGALTANHRVTIYKGCQTGNPGQAHCLIVDPLHPRLSFALTGRPTAVTSPMAAVLTSSQQT
jgi:hypothetical protein